MSVSELTVSIVGDMSKLSSVFSKVEKETGSLGNSFSTLGSKMGSTVSSGLKTLATTAVVTGAALGTGLVAAGVKSLSMFNDFEKSVSNAASVTGLAGEAFAAAKENISSVAQELGQKTAFSSSQAADALYNLASAGVDVSTITSSQLVPVLNLASGTQYDLAATTAAVTSTLSQFGLGFDSAGRVADVFAKDAGLTQASMDKLSLSMNYVGTIANTTGISLETTSAALGVLYNAGMDGSTAGTSLRGVIASLVTPTDKAVGVLKSMGLTVADVNPTTNDFTDIVQKLADKGLDANKAFQLFGRESAPAILALTSKSGDLKNLTSELENAGGAAQQMADQQLDTLAGSWDSFTGSIENLWINVGQALAPAARTVIDSLNSMIPSVQTWIVAIVEGFISLGGKIGSAISGIDFTGIFNSLKSAFDTGKSVVSGFIDDLSPTWDNLKSSFDSAKKIFDDFAPSISGILKAIGGPDAETAKTVGSALAGVINILTGAISGILKFAADHPTLTKFVVAIAAIATGLALLPAIVGIVSTGLVTLGLTIGTAIGGAILTISGFGSAVVAGLALVTSPIALVIGAIVLLYTAWKNNWGNIQGVTSSAVEFIKTNWTKFTTELGKLPGVASAALSTLKSTILEKWNAIIDDIQNWIQKQSNKYNEAIAKINQFKAQALAKWIEIKAAILAKLNAIITDAQAWISKQVAKYNEAVAKLTAFKTQSVARWTEIKAGILAKLNAIIADAQAWITKQVAKLNDMVAKYTAFKTQVVAKWTEIKTAIKTKLDEIVTEIKNKASSIGTALNNIVNTIKNKVADFKSAGKALIQGLIDGIEDKISGIKKAMSKVTNAADGFLTHSPAKEGPFKTLPTFDAVLYDPLMDTINKTESSVIPRLSQVVGKISNPLSNIKSPINSSLSGGLSNVSTSVSNISNTVSNIANSTANNYGGDTLNLGGVSVSDPVNLQTIFAQFEKYTANKRRAGGYKA